MNTTSLPNYRQELALTLAGAGMVITPLEQEQIKLIDFGLGTFVLQGLAMLVHVSTDRQCVKEYILSSRQTCPEHRHPPVTVDDTQCDPGMMVTYRCRSGRLWLYVEGTGNPDEIAAQIPADSEQHYTVFHEIDLGPGDQHTIQPNTRHWFQAGDAGAVVTAFSSTNRDHADVFTDPRIPQNTWSV